jgi:hypothetical protein
LKLASTETFTNSHLRSRKFLRANSRLCDKKNNLTEPTKSLNHLYLRVAREGLVHDEAIPTAELSAASCRSARVNNLSSLLTEKEAAAILRRSVSSLRRGRISGSGPNFIRLGRSIRYRLSDLQTYIEKNRKTTVQDVCL